MENGFSSQYPKLFNKGKNVKFLDMAKVCKNIECEYPVFGAGFCRNCQHLRTDGKAPKPLARTRIKPTRKPIKRISDKEKKRLSKYRGVRNKFMSENPICQVKGCKKPATDNHHQSGRIGDLLWDVTLFMAVCRTCHKKIEENPQWAYDNGYSVKRVEK